MDFHVFFHDSSESTERLKRIEYQLKLIIEQGENLMALSQESQNMLRDIDEDTSAIAKVISDLVANPNTTEAEFRTALQPIADHLDALGKTGTVPPLPASAKKK